MAIAYQLKILNFRRSGVKTKVLTSFDIKGSPEEDNIRDRFLEISDGRSVSVIRPHKQKVGGQ